MAHRNSHMVLKYCMALSKARNFFWCDLGLGDKFRPKTLSLKG